MSVRPTFRMRPGFRSMLATAALAGMALTAQADRASVGQVSLVIGEAHVLRSDGTREPVRRGIDVMVGDRITTAGNGHVHVRFIDNGVVSVRPESQLEVQSYRFDAQNPAVNEVRLRLEQGSSRSISGAATEADKSRFRLNTPIAAIGVRGTDFVVETSAAGVRATVADGAIVIGPLAGDCTAGSLGPCGGEATRVLSAGMGHLMAEVRPGEGRTRLVPVAGTVLAANATRSEEGHHGRAQAEPLTYSVNDRAAADLLTIAKVNIPDLNSPADLAGQLVWGRWGVGPAGDDRIAIPGSLAALGRHYTGIGDSDMGLFRANQTQPGALLSDGLSASVDFRLSRASASFERGSSVEAASIDGGKLNIDFARRTFATGLLLSSPTGGSAELRVAGDVRNNGTFAVRDSEQLVAGAVSVDGKEAGYLFERNTGGGLFKGRTLWGQPPGR
ncbi:MAG: FecR family protein [Rubrivivax sp.]